MMLIKRICDHLKRPAFEVMSWPYSELEFWALSFSITDNPPVIPHDPEQEQVTLQQSKDTFDKAWS